MRRRLISRDQDFSMLGKDTKSISPPEFTKKNVSNHQEVQIDAPKGLTYVLSPDGSDVEFLGVGVLNYFNRLGDYG